MLSVCLLLSTDKTLSNIIAELSYRSTCFSHVVQRVSIISNFILQSESSLAPTETFSERIKRFDLEFTFQLIGLMKKINDTAFDTHSSKLVNLVHRYVRLTNRIHHVV